MATLTEFFGLKKETYDQMSTKTKTAMLKYYKYKIRMKKKNKNIKQDTQSTPPFDLVLQESLNIRRNAVKNKLKNQNLKLNQLINTKKAHAQWLQKLQKLNKNENSTDEQIKSLLIDHDSISMYSSIPDYDDSTAVDTDMSTGDSNADETLRHSRER